jgi:hypothetical protein
MSYLSITKSRDRRMLAEAHERRHEGYRKKRHGESEQGHEGVLCEMKSELDFV